VFLGFQVLVVWAIFIFVYYRVWKVSTETMSAAGSTRDGERALALRLFLIVFLFSICWTPTMFVWLYTGFTMKAVPSWANAIQGIMVALNFVVDPALFLWISPDNRKSLVAFLTCSRPSKISKRAFELSTTATSRDSRGGTHGPSGEGREGREPSRSGASPRASPASSPPASPTPATVAPIAALPELALPPTVINLSASESDPEMHAEVRTEVPVTDSTGSAVVSESATVVVVVE
jgi:hypothetical protein